MTARFLTTFQRDFKELPAPIKKKFHRQLNTLLTHGVTYPGISVRKMTGRSGIWEARIDLHYRFTFQTFDDFVVLRRVGTHEIYRKP